MKSQDNNLNTELDNDLEAGPPAGDSPVEPQAEEPSYAVPPSPKKSKTPLILGIAAAVVILCVVCLVGVILARQYLPFFAPKRAAAKLIPAEADFFASIDIDIEDTVGYKHLAGIYGDMREVEKAIDDLTEEIEDQFGVSYKDDIKPWLGPELAIAVTNMESLVEGEDSVIIIAAATRDKKASNAFLEKMREFLEDQGYDVDEETYKGVTYYVEEETPYVFGTVKKFVILTLDKDAMEDLIDVAKGDSDSLAENGRYTDLASALPDDAVAYVFLDMEDLEQAGLKSIEGEGLDLPGETSGQIESFQALGLALDLDKEGVKFDAAMTFDPDALPPQALESLEASASANRILKRIPDDALGFLSSQNLAAVWKNIFATMAQNPDFANQIEDLESTLGLKLDEELLDWLSGEFAIAVVKARGGMAEDVPVGGFAVFEIDDREGAKAKLEDIVDALGKFAAFGLEKEDIGNVEMQVLRDPYSEEIILGYGFTDEHLIIGFSENALEDAADDDIRSVAADETFKKMQKHLPGKTGGYFYVNVEAAWRLAYKSMSEYDKETFNEEARPFLEPIKAIGAAAPPTDPQKGISRGTIFVYIPGE